MIIRFVIGHQMSHPSLELPRLILSEMQLQSQSCLSCYCGHVEYLLIMFFHVFLQSYHNSAATLGATLARHREKSRVYIGCMKSGPVLAQK